MASSSALTTVQKLYIAYYGRAADAAGQLYWADQLDLADGALVGIIDAFANAPEAQALYGSGTTPAERITVLYQNILGRAPDPAGLDYYVGEVNSGRLSLGNTALAILNGVQGDDVPLANNRLSVANAFTSQVSSAAKSYENDAAAAIARTFLKQVTGSAGTVSQANDQLTAWLNTIAIASKQPEKFLPLISNGLLTHIAIVSSTLTQDNLDAALATVMHDTTAPAATLVVTGGAALIVQLEAMGNARGNDSDPQLTAVGSNGAFAVTWQGIDSAGDSSIFVQKFNADGTTTGQAPVQLEATGTSNAGDYAAQIAAAATAGGYVVAWSGAKSTNSTDTAIFVQMFNPDGTTAGHPPVQIEAPQFPNGIDALPQIAPLGDTGAFAVVWRGTGSAMYDRIFVQQFNADGTVATVTPSELEAVSRPVGGHDDYPQATAIGTSALAITWVGYDGANHNSVFVQKRNADGSASGHAPIQLDGMGNAHSLDYAPQITAVGSQGGFVVAWSGYDSDAQYGDTSVFVQPFNADGSTTGHSLVRLEATGKTNGDDGQPQITALGSSGEFVVAWSGEDTDGTLGDYSILVQKFNVDGTTTGQTPVQLEAIGRINGDDRTPQITAVGSQGEFVVTWWGQDENLNDYSIFVQKFNANGTIVGQAPVQLEAIGVALGDDYAPQVSSLGSNGEFAITWYGKDSDGDNSIFVQKFLADGRPVGRTVTVDSGATLTVRSSEVGTAYLVNTHLTVGAVADITNAADALWNSVLIFQTQTDTALSLAGLQAGSYQLYTSDGAGNLSAVAIPTVVLATNTPSALQSVGDWVF